jgi:S-DNA-T family DNA segregation ATPase FtsK/SpoIIIE
VVDSIDDVELRHGPDATVGELLVALGNLADADATTEANGGAENEQGTAVGGRLPLLERTGQPLAPELTIDSIGLRDGDKLSLIEPPSNWTLTAEQQRSSGSATLEMLSGPLKGARYALGQGSSTIGRVAANDLVIVDPGISRQHAVVVIDETSVTIVDNGSTNGIQVEGRPITEPTEITSGKPILVGHSLMAITHHPPLTAIDRPGLATVARSERQVHRFDDRMIVLPEPPEPAGKRRRPELLGSGRGRHRQEVEQFEASVAAIEQQLDEGRRTETTSRFYEAPAISELLAESASRWRLWERRALDPDGLEVRLGIGTMPSRTELRVPDGGDPELRSMLAELVERYRRIPDLPAVIDFRRVGSVGLHGPTAPVRGLAHSLVLQLAWFHGPDQLWLACAPGAEAESWGWMKWLPQLSGEGDEELDPDARFAGWLSALLDGTPTSYVDPVAARRPPGETLWTVCPSRIPARPPLLWCSTGTTRCPIRC